MKKLSMAVSLLLMCSVASAQSLASVAEKEKERREANRKAGVKALKISQTEAGADSTSPTSELSETGIPAVETAAKDEPTTATKEEKSQPDPWDAIYSEYLARYRSAANEIDQLKAEQAGICKDINRSSVGVTVAPEGGTVYNVPNEQQNRCSAIPGRLTRLELEIKQIKHDCAEDARRRGILPGRARLYR